MRFILFGLLLSLCAFAGGQPGVVILFEYENGHTVESFEEMQAELSNVLKDSGVPIEWQQKTSASFPATPAELIILRFQGRCRMDGIFEKSPENGALAVTHVVNGEILPFSDVDCDRVRANVRSAMLGYDPRLSEFLLGRALGRVVAHELLHILGKSNAHGRHGIMRRWLSGPQLICEHLEVAPEDLERVLAKRNERRHTEPQVQGGG